jgi:hypothetical protein
MKKQYITATEAADTIWDNHGEGADGVRNTLATGTLEQSVKLLNTMNGWLVKKEDRREVFDKLTERLAVHTKVNDPAFKARQKEQLDALIAKAKKDTPPRSRNVTQMHGVRISDTPVA